jgi:hypothetical protein
LTAPFPGSGSARRSGRDPLRWRRGTPPSSIQMPPMRGKRGRHAPRFPRAAGLRIRRRRMLVDERKQIGVALPILTESGSLVREYSGARHSSPCVHAEASADPSAARQAAGRPCAQPSTPAADQPLVPRAFRRRLDQRRAVARAQGALSQAERRFPTWPIGDDGRVPRLPDCFRTPPPSSALARAASPAPSPSKTTRPPLRRNGGRCRLRVLMDECG